jgi:formate C-acetyltransferase
MDTTNIIGSAASSAANVWMPVFTGPLGWIPEGGLTRDEALELIVEFFYKNDEIMSPADHMSLDDVKTQFTLEMTFDDPNYIILGGLLPGKRGGVNEVTHLFIEVQHILQLRVPFIVLRYYSGIDEDFWQKACAAMRDNTTIVIYNGNTMIPALTAYGIREEDAVDYSGNVACRPRGCVKSKFRRQ